MYQAHPSRVLTELFARRPYQGAPPKTARFLFVGLDANYAADVEQSAIFPALRSYHEDGPTFWRKHGVHHPFLLPEYRGDGRRYHRTFAKIGFRPEHADLVSFIELLHVPTVGRSTLVPDDLDSTHLDRLKDAMFKGQARYVFLSAGVLRRMNDTEQFPELKRASGPSGSLRTLYKDAAREIFLHLHFSNYGKFEAQLQAEAGAIAALLPGVDIQELMMAETAEQIATEIRDRVVRLETRIVQLGDYVGANLRTKQRITIVPANSHSPPGAVRVEIDAMDVSVSRILTELRQHGVKEGGPIDVFCDGRCVFTLHL
ncbi:hypothetical protein LJR130_003039 [Variovorax sp. LjRoot130]|uniref:hypothetical protein n=1 Tax=Variovorax sp. LjRoot130 TaxID=3342261 RepID=UPI003ECF02F0